MNNSGHLLWQTLRALTGSTLRKREIVALISWAQLNSPKTPFAQSPGVLSGWLVAVTSSSPPRLIRLLELSLAWVTIWGPCGCTQLSAPHGCSLGVIRAAKPSARWILLLFPVAAHWSINPIWGNEQAGRQPAIGQSQELIVSDTLSPVPSRAVKQMQSLTGGFLLLLEPKALSAKMLIPSLHCCPNYGTQRDKNHTWRRVYPSHAEWFGPKTLHEPPLLVLNPTWKQGRLENAHTRFLHKPVHAQPWKKEVAIVLLLPHHH